MEVRKFLAFVLTIVINIDETLQNTLKQNFDADFFYYPSQDGSNTLIQASLRPPNSTNQPGIKEANPADIHFYLYTPSNPKRPVELVPGNKDTLNNSTFVKNAPVKILCHGFASGHKFPFPLRTRAKYLAVQGLINVIVIDWSILAASPYYVTASLNVDLVGRKTADLINFLVQSNVVQLEKFHLVGHSLGAHAMGIAGRKLGKGQLLNRVTGLDPASPLWEGKPASISQNVAQFVDIIHSNALALGIRKPVGLADFYPNGGDIQAGCGLDPFGACSHDRSYEFFTESIVGPSETPKFQACRCNNCHLNSEELADCMRKKYLAGSCKCQPTVYMGDSVPGWIRVRGSYYLETNPSSPFSKEIVTA